MAKKRHVPKDVSELSVLRLAAMAIEVRSGLTPEEIRRIPSLEDALTALGKVLDELGWADERFQPNKTGCS